ncbi:MAG: ankyrin repeat domain-containing protein [Epsilonproteobacteria bacterium]|nr:ankyrin repeat domain-containing protein [Campylobacterota bacterium]
MNKATLLLIAILSTHSVFGAESTYTPTNNTQTEETEQAQETDYLSELTKEMMGEVMSHLDTKSLGSLAQVNLLCNTAVTQHPPYAFQKLIKQLQAMHLVTQNKVLPEVEKQRVTAIVNKMLVHIGFTPIQKLSNLIQLEQVTGNIFDITLFTKQVIEQTTDSNKKVELIIFAHTRQLLTNQDLLDNYRGLLHDENLSHKGKGYLWLVCKYQDASFCQDTPCNIITNNNDELQQFARGVLSAWYQARKKNDKQIPTFVTSQTDLYTQLQHYYQAIDNQLFTNITTTTAEDLITQDADVNAKDAQGNTPLSRAALNNHTQMAELLINNGANVNAKDGEGWTPLHAAVINNPDNTETTQLLIQNGANINAKNNHGCTPLHNIAFLADNTETSQLFIQNGADINARSNHGKTPLHYTALTTTHTNIKIAQFLITNGADINALDNTTFAQIAQNLQPSLLDEDVRAASTPNRESNTSPVIETNDSDQPIHNVVAPHNQQGHSDTLRTALLWTTFSGIAGYVAFKVFKPFG